MRYPMEHGIVKDWNDMERIWQYVYSKEQLQTFSEEVGSFSFLSPGLHSVPGQMPSSHCCLPSSYGGGIPKMPDIANILIRP